MLVVFLQEEAKRWKERGNHVCKEHNSVELAIAYYSLALSYTPPYERDLKATILSNRSLMYKKTGKDEEALRDAQQCVQNNPNWAKVTKGLFTWSGGPRSSGVGFFCFVSPRA